MAKDFKIEKAYKHKGVGQIYRAVFKDGSVIDVEATSDTDAEKKVSDHLKTVADLQKQQQQEN